LLPIVNDCEPRPVETPRSRPEVDFLAAPILMSGFVPGSCKVFGGGGAGFGAGGGGNGGGNGDGFGTSTLGDPPPPIHIINSPFE
jgi:hypothetical protein